MKHYRNLNGCVSKMHRVIYDAYDKGYAQGRKDFEKPETKWIEVPLASHLSLKCENCQTLVIARYFYCPWCGCPTEEVNHGKTED